MLVKREGGNYHKLEHHIDLTILACDYAGACIQATSSSSVCTH